MVMTGVGGADDAAGHRAATVAEWPTMARLGMVDWAAVAWVAVVVVVCVAMAPHRVAVNGICRRARRW